MTDKKEAAEQPIDMRRHILTVAGGLMIEKGVKETSLKDIAQEAGISKGTLYYYYSAKEDIIYDIANHNLKQITDGLLAWIEDANTEVAPEEVLKTVFEQILGAETRGKLHLYLLSDAGTSNTLLKEKFKEQYQEWRKTLQCGLDKILPSQNQKNVMLSYLILAALDGLIIQRLFGTKEIPVEEIVKLLVSAE
ncbi:TetR family transcriptional regulator [Desulfitobacterium sp. LBE]|uniref:HTH tetR-type domain-containing protein n=2 Tax=root TaxID=1 RepID=A0A644TBR1_9ZZZZ|nr:TetR family transcriptional regulator [Desulfitobacterium sp. LBE]